MADERQDPPPPPSDPTQHREGKDNERKDVENKDNEDNNKKKPISTPEPPDANDASSDDSPSEVHTATIIYNTDDPEEEQSAVRHWPGRSISDVELSELPSPDRQPTRSILIHRVNSGSLIDDTTSGIQMRYSSESGIYRFYKTQTHDSSHRHLPKTEAFIYMVIPPDGGYAWVILFVAFFCQIIVDGLLYSIGTILPAIAEDLQVSSKQTALVASTQIAPLSSAFINKFGFRPVAVVGGIVSSVAVLIASFSRKIWMLIIFQGIFAGISMGMVYMATSLIINYYFERYRAVVCGLSSAGSGVGMILMNLLNVNIVNVVGWSNTIRVHTLLLAITAVMTFAYREVQPSKLGQYVELYPDVDEEESFNSVEIDSHQYSEAAVKADIAKSVTSLAANAGIEARLTLLVQPKKKSFFSRICPWCTKERRFSTIGSKRYLIKHDPLDRQDIFYDNRPDYRRTRGMELKNVEVIDPANESKARTITYTFSVIRAAPPFQEDKPRFSMKIKSAVNALFDLSLLDQPEFRLIILESFLFPMGYNIPYVYSSERAEISKHLADLLPVVIGITNIIFRLIIGFVAFKIKCHTAYLSGFGMVFGGLVTLLSAFVGQSTIWFQFLFVVCFGIAAASYSAARAIVYVKVLGLDKLTNAFGLTTMVMGIGAFIGTSIAGAMNDLFGGYTVTFALSGIAMTIAGCLKLILPKYVTYRARFEARATQKKVRFVVGSSSKKWWQK